MPEAGAPPRAPARGNVIKLNVGGTHFTTRRATLCAYPDSMLGRMFAEENGALLDVDSDGCPFIDRDPTHFGAILNWLRTGYVELPGSVANVRALRLEAEYYMLDEHMFSRAARALLDEQCGAAAAAADAADRACCACSHGCDETLWNALVNGKPTCQSASARSALGPHAYRDAGGPPGVLEGWRLLASCVQQQQRQQRRPQEWGSFFTGRHAQQLWYFGS